MAGLLMVLFVLLPLSFLPMPGLCCFLCVTHISVAFVSLILDARAGCVCAAAVAHANIECKCLVSVGRDDRLLAGVSE